MKKRIGILKGHPIIEGDKNLKNNNEIHISDLYGGGASSGGSGSGELGDNVFDIRYIDLRGISNKRARMIISCYSNYQVYYDRLQSKVVTGCVAAQTLYPLQTTDLAYSTTYTMACMLNVGMIIENNVSLRDAILNSFDIDIETLPTLTKEEFLNLGANDYSNWIYNDINQPFYD